LNFAIVKYSAKRYSIKVEVPVPYHWFLFAVNPKNCTCRNHDWTETGRHTATARYRL